MTEPNQGVISKSWKVVGRWRFVILLLLMLPLVMGTRRGEVSGCRASSGRQLIFLSNAGNQTIAPSGTRTQDIPVNPSAATTIRYRGDESSVLYAWSERQAGETLIGRRYFAVSQYLGQMSSHGDETFSFTAASVEMPDGIPIVRQYDQGNCSLFQPWSSFQETFKNALDQFAQERGARHFTNSTLTPLLMLDATVPTGRIYLGDTSDTFRFTRGYNINRGPVGYPMIVRIEGGFRTSAGAVRFTPTSITVRNPDGNTNAETLGLELALTDEFVSQLNLSLDDLNFHRLPASFTPQRCTPSLAGETGRCTDLLNLVLGNPTNVFHGIRAGLLPAQVRCQRRPGDTGVGGFCEFRPNFLRTQEYPEGFEFVLSEVVGDQGRQLIDVYGDPDRLCPAGPRPPLTLDGTFRGIVRRFDAP